MDCPRNLKHLRLRTLLPAPVLPGITFHTEPR
jgi:hypothetical protein